MREHDSHRIGNPLLVVVFPECGARSPPKRPPKTCRNALRPRFPESKPPGHCRMWDQNAQRQTPGDSLREGLAAGFRWAHKAGRNHDTGPARSDHGSRRTSSTNSRALCSSRTIRRAITQRRATQQASWASANAINRNSMTTSSVVFNEWPQFNLMTSHDKFQQVSASFGKLRQKPTKTSKNQQKPALNFSEKMATES